MFKVGNMGLFKSTKDKDLGIPVTYHRISSIRQCTNQWIQLQVCSYISQEDRNEEQRNIERQENGEDIVNVFSSVEYFSLPYIDGITCTQAYEYLKTLPEFEGATDVFDKDDE